MENTDSRKPIFVLPNPALRGGELQVSEMQNAKQTRYAEARRQHRDAWWRDNRKWLAARGLTEHDGPPMGDRGG